MTPAGKRQLLPFATALAVALAALLVYLPARENGFVDYDDGAYVTKNPEVSAGWTTHGVRWAFTSSHSSNWHPLTWMSHMVDVELFGLDPRGHHLMNVALFALSAALCLLAFERMTGRLVASLAVSALFVTHPLRVESVAWVSERKDVLSGVFFFLVLLAHASRARATTVARARRASIATALFLVLGLLAKQMLVTVPLLLLVLDLGPLGRRARATPTRPGDQPGPPPTLRDLILEKAPLIAIAVGAGIATLIAQRLGGAVRSFESIPLAVRLSNAIHAYAAYLEKAVHPTQLSVFYPHPWLVTPAEVSLWGPTVLLSAATLLAISACALLARRRSPWLLAGWLWYLGMALPVIGIVQVGAQWMADRYAYLPHVGLYAMVVLGLGDLASSERVRHALAGAALLAACVFVPMTRARIAVWHDTRTLFEDALRHTSHNYLAHVNLGYIDHREGELDAAEAHYREALLDAPHMADAHTNLAGIELARGRTSEARASLDAALAADPGFVNAWLLYGLLEEQAGHPDKALDLRRRAFELDPSSVAAGVEYGRSLLEAGRVDEALSVLGALAADHPNHTDAQVTLARAESAAGRDAEARERLERILDRGEASVATELAWLLATSADGTVRDPDRALRLARGIERPDWRALRSLAAALAATGAREEACSALLDAAAAAPKARTSSLMALRERIQRGEALR